MNELDLFLAKTQARLAFFLIITLVALCVGVTLILLLPNVQINPAASNLLVQVVTGVLALSGTACGFFFARTRPGGIPDATQMVTQSHTSPDGSKTTVTSPVNAPPASIPTLPNTSAASPLVKPPPKESP